MAVVNKQIELPNFYCSNLGVKKDVPAAWGNAAFGARAWRQPRPSLVHGVEGNGQASGNSFTVCSGNAHPRMLTDPGPPGDVCYRAPLETGR